MISIIVPTYNAEKYLATCLDSILNQSYHDIEVICINDGSTDSSLNILRSYEKRDTRIKVIDQKNRGLSGARNTGIENSSGEFLTFVDSDDKLEDGAIDKLYAAIISDPTVGAAVGAIKVSYEAHEELRESDEYYYSIRYSGITELNDQVIDNFHCSACGVLLKRSIIDFNQLRFPEGLNYEDAYWHWCYFTRTAKVNFLNTPIYHYFRHPVSIMSQTVERREGFAIQHIIIAEKILDFWQERNMLSQRVSTAINIVEAYFWFSYKNSPRFERVLVVHECVRIIKKFKLDISKNITLLNIVQGNVGFLFSDDLAEADSDFAHYLQIKNIIECFLPLGSFRRKLAYRLARAGYRCLKRLS